jgi:hypothetical protein
LIFYPSRNPDPGVKRHQIPDPDPQHCIYINNRSISRAQISYLRIRTVEIIEEDAAHTAGDVPVLYAEIVIAPRLEFAVVSAKKRTQH